MSPFIGRTAELAELEALRDVSQSKLVIVEGRRRIGKSRLVEEFARGERFLQFVGLAPTPDTTAQSQRDEFARQLSAQTGLPRLSSDDWASLFQLLGREAARGRVLVLFDEISWMAHGDPTFLGKLKTAWDLHLSKNPRLMLILCGSGLKTTYDGFSSPRTACCCGNLTSFFRIPLARGAKSIERLL